MTKEEIKGFLREQIIGVNKAIERYDNLTPKQRNHWMSTKEQLIERRNNFQNTIDKIRELEKKIELMEGLILTLYYKTYDYHVENLKEKNEVIQELIERFKE